MRFLDIHTHRSSQDLEVKSILSISLTAGMFTEWPAEQEVSAGLHPWYAMMDQFETDYRRLAEVLRNPDVKLMGECGLDKLRGEKLDNQIFILRKQLSLAAELHKPVILHCVKCFDELMALRKEMKLEVPLIIHGFNKSEELARQLLDKGFYLSFGAAILNKDAAAAAILEKTDNFFLETDDSGCDIREIYEAAANLKNCTLESLKALIFANWKKIKLI